MGQKVWFQTLPHSPHLTFPLFVSSWPCWYSTGKAKDAIGVQLTHLTIVTAIVTGLSVVLVGFNLFVFSASIRWGTKKLWGIISRELHDNNTAENEENEKDEEDEEDEEKDYTPPIAYNFNCENAVKDSIFCVNNIPRKA